jgi:WD40 repeat protein
LESDLALRTSLKFLPRLIGKKEIGDAEIFSPDLNYAAIVTLKKDSTLLAVKKTSKDSVIATIPLADRPLPFGLSNDAGRIGIIDQTPDGTLFRIIEINGKRHWDITLRKEVDIFYKVALSPDGRHLLLAYCEDGDMDRTMTGYVMDMVAEVWDVEQQKLITTLDTKGFLQIHVMAFSPQGKYIAIGGMGRGPRGNDR